MSRSIGLRASRLEGSRFLGSRSFQPVQDLKHEPRTDLGFRV